VNLIDLPVAAGSAATAVFAVSTLPMLVKARRSRDVGSYSLANIALGNLGNVLYTLYVLHLPPGPIWALHAFHTVSTALMLIWYLRYHLLPRVRSRARGAEAGAGAQAGAGAGARVRRFAVRGSGPLARRRSRRRVGT
jgi:hypothetical protein